VPADDSAMMMKIVFMMALARGMHGHPVTLATCVNAQPTGSRADASDFEEKAEVNWVESGVELFSVDPS
jgi:hypothetical protein